MRSLSLSLAHRMQNHAIAATLAAKTETALTAAAHATLTQVRPAEKQSERKKEQKDKQKKREIDEHINRFIGRNSIET